MKKTEIVQTVLFLTVSMVGFYFWVFGREQAREAWTGILTQGESPRIETAEDPPPGFRIVRGKGGEWSFIYGEGDRYLFDKDTRQEAVDAAWGYYKFLIREQRQSEPSYWTEDER